MGLEYLPTNLVDFYGNMSKKIPYGWKKSQTTTFWMYKTLQLMGYSTIFQLVQDFFHQQHLSCLLFQLFLTLPQCLNPRESVGEFHGSMNDALHETNMR